MALHCDRLVFLPVVLHRNTAESKGCSCVVLATDASVTRTRQASTLSADVAEVLGLLGERGLGQYRLVPSRGRTAIQLPGAMDLPQGEVLISQHDTALVIKE